MLGVAVLRRLDGGPMSELMRAIETVYLGYRFRSRLEARWAHFFETLGVTWEYEPEGYEIGGRRYLPDFYLPSTRTFLEVKPRRGEEVDEKPREIVRSGGDRFAFGNTERSEMVVVYGDPLNADADVLGLFRSRRTEADDVWVSRGGAAHVCPVCRAIKFDRVEMQSVRTWDTTCRCGRTTLPAFQAFVADAALTSRQARFEHGEQPNQTARLSHRLHDVAPPIYLAGKIGGKDGWRRQIGVPLGYDEDDDRHGRVLEVGARIATKYRPWTYNGPDLSIDHGYISHGIVDDCLRRLVRSNTLFAWIDSDDTHGTLAELGFWRGMCGASGIEVGNAFVAFSSRELHDEMWFISTMATVAVVVPTIEQAWDAFLEWEEYDRCYLGQLS